MKKRELILMLLPVAILAGIGWLTFGNGPLLVIEKVETRPVAPSVVGTTYQRDADTEVRVTMHYSPRSLETRFQGSPNYRNIESDYFLIDQQGRVYRRFKTRLNDGKPNYIMGPFGEGRANPLIYVYQFPLKKIPRSAGKVTFKAKISVDEGFVIPISVVVRD